jgi:hypothetical protein
MPVQTQILTRRGTAASWTSTNPTLGAGEIGYETDTGRFKIGTGAAAWASLGYFNRDPLTTKGDLYTFSTTDDRLAVGANGETLVADSSTSTGLRYQATQAAGKNALINGGFDIWQRGTSFTSSLVYGADRWFEYFGSGTFTYARTTSNLPDGFQYGMQITSNSTTASAELYQTMETANCIRFAGKTIVVSGWVRSSSNVTATVLMGSSTATDEPQSGTFSSISGTGTSWATTGTATRFSATFVIPSTAKSLRFGLQTGSLASAATFTVTGLQIEEGNVATGFMRTGGTIQGELAACQRYYFRWTATDLYSPFSQGISTTTTNAQIFVQYPVTMRTKPTVLEFSTLVISDIGSYNLAISAITLSNGSSNVAEIGCTNAATATANRAAFIRSNNSASGYLAFGAEL